MKMLTLVIILALTGCSSVTQIGTVGPHHLPVYIAKHNDFLTATRMIIVVSQDGHIVATTNGATAAGYGTVVTNFAGQAVIGAGVAYAGYALGKGLLGMQITADGGLDLRASPTQVNQAIDALDGL